MNKQTCNFTDNGLLGREKTSRKPWQAKASIILTAVEFILQVNGWLSVPYGPKIIDRCLTLSSFTLLSSFLFILVLPFHH